MLKYNTDKIVLYSNEDCFVDLVLYIKEDNFINSAYIRRLHINAKETNTFTLEDLAPGFYSDKAEILQEDPWYREIYVEQ